MPIFCSKCGKENRDTSKFCNNCASSLQISISSGPLQTGTILENRYKIINLIKSGGMGAVYKAVDTKFDSTCAIKELLPPYGATPQQEAQAAEWFKREAKILNTLHHTNLPKVSDYFINYNRYYLVMTFVEGEDLETILARDGKPGLPVDKVVGWAKEILQVLEYIHNQNPPIVYRDIKPGNIMLHKNGRAMLIDFGIARIVQDSSQTKKTAIGTQGYAPPEQCRGQVEPRSDLYALGATMHHLLTGIEPIPFKFEPLRNIVPSVSKELEQIVIKALKDNLKERFSGAKEMREALVNLSSPLQTVNTPSPIIKNVTPQKVIKSLQIHQTVQSMPPVKQPVIEPDMIYINEGSFQMGSNNIYDDDEQPIHEVTVSGFYIGKYPVTNKEYCLYKPSHKNPGDNLPVVNVSWNEAADYCKWLSEQTCKIYRLPTEAEWEYACRAGSKTAYYWSSSGIMGNYAWYDDNSGGKVHPVGQKKSNAWGLYDMSGNVFEWCSDWYDENYYSVSPSNNPTGPISGSYHVLRGGSWYLDSNYCRSSCRYRLAPDCYYDYTGFRIVRDK